MKLLLKVTQNNWKRMFKYVDMNIRSSATHDSQKVEKPKYPLADKMFQQNVMYITEEYSDIKWMKAIKQVKTI